MSGGLRSVPGGRPGDRRSSRPGDRPGALVATRLSVLAAEVSDPDRFRRGRVYTREGAVLDIEVHPGEVVGRVQGSRSEPYTVTLRVEPWTPGSAPLPGRAEVSSRCTCPDGVSVCKHAVAVLLTFADAVGAEPGLLTRWRRVDPSAPLPAPELDEPTPARGSVRAHARTPEREPEPDPLEGFFGAKPASGSRWVESVLTPLTRPPRAHAGSELDRVALDALDEALRALESMFG